MDSVSHVVLGAAIGMGAMGRRTALWKAAVWGAVACTLPDLDVFIDHGDAVRDMVLHRAETHAPFWLTLFSLPLAAAVAWVHAERALWRRWWLALWLSLVAHPLLDLMTVYGTRAALPFSDRPFGLGSIFIIDPLYTLPLLVGTGLALTRGSLRANALGLVLSTAYLGWGAMAQQHVERIARASLAEQGLAAGQLLVTPTAFNSVLWRVLVVDGALYREGFYSLLDQEPRIRFDRFERGTALGAPLSGSDSVRRIAAFSRGFYKFSADGADLRITDLRMGQEPTYIFSFVVGQQASATMAVEPPRQVGTRPDLARALSWTWQRARNEATAPLR